MTLGASFYGGTGTAAQSCLFLHESGTIGITSFGENTSWSESSAFFEVEDSPPAHEYEEDMLLDASWMQPPESSSREEDWRLLQDQVDSVHVKHEPPPLNMKRLEKEAGDEAVEAAEVSVDVIRNRRPFQCGHAGCNKTFKNAQTMKMHHKTHYSDGRGSLPTLTPSLRAGHTKKLPSRCPRCRKTFVGLYELRRHFGRKHSEGEKPFACRKCHKRFYVEVDVRDHEKLCGEPILCKCGLKFAFKCNLVAHKKAHPACQESHPEQHPSPTPHSSTTSDEDLGQSRGSSRLPLIAGSSTKRSHGEGESIRASKQARLYSSPAPHFRAVDATTTFKAAFYDFSGLHFCTEGSSLRSSNMHYPSVASLPSHYSILEDLGGQVYTSHRSPHMGKFQTVTPSPQAPAWNSIPGL